MVSISGLRVNSFTTRPDPYPRVLVGYIRDYGYTRRPLVSMRYQSASASSSYAHKRPALPPVDVLRPMTASVDYAAMVTSQRSTSMPPSTSYVRQQTPSQHHRPQSARRLSSTSSLSDLSSPGALSSVRILHQTRSTTFWTSISRR